MQNLDFQYTHTGETPVELFERVRSFINTCNDVSLLRRMLDDTLSNSSDGYDLANQLSDVYL